MESEEGPFCTGTKGEKLKIAESEKGGESTGPMEPGMISDPSPRHKGRRTNHLSKSLPTSMKERALNMEPLFGFENDEYNRLLEELVEERRRTAASHNFSESSRITDAIKHVEDCQIRQKKYELQVAACQEYEEQVQQFEESLRQFDEESDRMEEELRAKLADQKQKVIAVHQYQMKCLEDRWSSQAMQRRYNHASFTLRNNKKQFRLLMLDCRFKEAERVKASIDKMERSEQADAIKQMQADFDDAEKALVAKQMSEIQNIDQKAELQIQQLRQRRGWLRQAFLNKKRKFEQRAEQIADPDKLWNLSMLQRKEEMATGSSLMTPNTSARLSETDIQDREEATIRLPPLKLGGTARTRRSARY